ncbi:AlgJ [Desulforapulum autotrophicum HRM2]|uniref:AlgJ n=1 Tax=Desulforapulum autotrophicum (strain ATCC 43914 / DSM 3382 / VKM B-1955 / HRM2) TaxID=177437 RepID=C0QK44_DESAH|nr:protein AlgJ [Desulforapulum autotrophicum]ACN16070.1 AlgJ [Desulforapulum autotrophicum HRM2]
MEKILHRYLNITVVLLFMAGICLPLFTHLYGLFDTGYIETVENRYPQVKPSLPRSLEALHTYPRKMTDYINDHFGFREMFIRCQGLFNHFLGITSSDRVMIGKDGWLFLTDEDMVPQYTGAMNFSREDLDNWITKMEERGAWLKFKGIPFYVVIPPNKMTVYPEFLPDYINKLPVLTRLEQLETQAPGFKNFVFCSLRTGMIHARKNMSVYYKTDSHWNFHGAFFAYQQIMALLKKDFPDLHPLGETDVVLTPEKSFEQDLSRILHLPGAFPDTNADGFILKQPTRVKNQTVLDKEKSFPKIVQTGQTGKPVALVFRDSYTDAMEPFLNETFGTVIYAEYQWMVFDKRLIEAYKPDVVIHIMVERMLRYKPDNASLESTETGFSIKKWGPHQVKQGERFNVQSNGLSALWMICDELSEDTVIVWNNTPLKTDIDLTAFSLAAVVPDQYYAAPGKYPVYLKNTQTGEVTEPVYFYVTQ